MLGDISEYLLGEGEKSLYRNLLKDYKEKRGLGYVESGFVAPPQYHHISPDSPMCYLKSESLPSQAINQTPHKMWVMITKVTGSVQSAWCSCFAG